MQRRFATLSAHPELKFGLMVPSPLKRTEELLNCFLVHFSGLSAISPKFILGRDKAISETTEIHMFETGARSHSTNFGGRSFGFCWLAYLWLHQFHGLSKPPKVFLLQIGHHFIARPPVEHTAPI